MSGPNAGKQKSRRKYNRKGKRTRDVSTQCGKWLQLKLAIEKDEKLRAEVLEDVENIIAVVGYPKPDALTPEDERIRLESRQALSVHHIADLALLVQPLNTCKWIV
ncbi:hypothetical protein PYW08_000645 [Mythimna loreyi]|uniref:Uncharacterized protein n=1 Tax=Mythimna loreyi TaxID=667449 RepID=A0ACC2RD21_9NEOP|nr:hypothetical protein PYW08_000645 [Mythimna loreyi]